jgi:myo-inositol-1(or 4)-monophosphatase
VRLQLESVPPTLAKVSLLREIGCWPWDVCAGVVVAEEAGGIVTGSHEVFEATKNTDQFGVVTEEILTGRKYLVVRGIGSTPVSGSC